MKQLLCCALMCAAGLHPCMAQIQWVKRLHGDASYGRFIAADKSGRTYVVGQFFGTVSLDQHVVSSRGDLDVFVLALDENGNTKFVTSFGGLTADVPTAIAIKPNGDLFVAVRIAADAPAPEGSGVHNGASIAKFDIHGDVKWVRLLDDSNATVASMRAEHGNEELWICGFGSDGLFTSARNKKGKEVFRTSTSLPPEVTVSAVTLDRNHNAIVNGSWTGQPRLGELDFPFKASLYRGYNFVAKFGADGQWQWIGSGLWAYGIYLHVDVIATAMASTSSGDIFTTGQVTDSQLFVTHHSPTGELVNATTRGEFRGKYGGLGLAVDRSGNAYTAGYGVGSWSNPNRRFAALVTGPNFDYSIHSMSLEGRSYARGICVDDKNRVYVTGDFTGKATFGGELLGDAEGSPPHTFIMRIDDATRPKNE